MLSRESHLSLETLFESEDGRVDRVFELHVVVEPFLQKRLPVHVVLPHRSRLPREVRAGGIALEESEKQFYKNCFNFVELLSIDVCSLKSMVQVMVKMTLCKGLQITQ